MRTRRSTPIRTATSRRSRSSRPPMECPRLSRSHRCPRWSSCSLKSNRVRSIERSNGQKPSRQRSLNDLWRRRMFVKTVSTIARFSLVVLPVAALATASCGGGGNGGTAGSTGTGGTSGTGGGGGAVSCITGSPTAADSTIMDWENVATGAAASSFLGYKAGTYGGGTFEYPAPAMGSPCDPTIHLCPNFDGKNWHITGTVHDYSGFGIYFTPGSVWDVS